MLSSIRQDARHTGLIEIYKQPSLARVFPEWTMPMVRIDKLRADQQNIYRNLRQVALGPGLYSVYRQTVNALLDRFRKSVR